MHHHVVACNASGQVFREHSFDDGPRSVEVFLALTRQFFQDKITTSPTEIEQKLHDSLDESDQDAITIGNPQFIMAWVPCNGCVSRKIYN